MGEVKHISKILKLNKYNNDNNVNKSNSLNNDSNVTSSRYSLDRNKFTPNTEETQLAEEIATYFGDLKNYASYLNVVNKLGIVGARTLFRETQSDIEEKSETKTPVRKPAAYFMWKFKRALSK